MTVLAVCLNPALDKQFFVEDFSINKLHILSNTDVETTPGGKGINVAVILATYGIRSIVTGFLGGFTGQIILSKLRNYRDLITTNFVLIEDETRENIAIADPENHTLTELNSTGPSITEEDLDYFLSRFEVLVQKADIVVMSGSVPKNTPHDIYGTLTKIARKYGKKVIWEVREEFIVEGLKVAVPDIVKIDARFSEKLYYMDFSNEKEYIDSLKKIYNQGLEMLITSYKTVNNIIITKEGIWKLSPKVNIEMANLLGTGDTFVAGLVYALSLGKCCIEMGKFGYAAAVAKTWHSRKESPTLEEIQKSLEMINVERID